MARIDGRWDTILTKTVDRIISQVPGFDEHSCFMSVDPDLTPPNPGNFLCLVAPSGGQFDEGMLEGGGQNQCTLDAGIIVKIHSPMQLDQARHDASFLTDRARGILEKWRLLIKALADWSPVDGSLNELTRNPLIPANVTIDRNGRESGAIETVFKLTFDLDLA